MKYLLPFLVLLFWQTAFSATPGETNNYFYTYEAYPKYENATESIVNPKKIEEAKGSRESWQTNDFPEGNWGQTFRGFQLSLRFDKKIYTNGESITAIILVRNVTNHEIVFMHSTSTGANGPIGFVITNDHGNKLSSKWAMSPAPGQQAFMGSINSVTIATQTQRKIIERLDKIYDLTNGTYLVQASLGYQLIKRRSDEGKPLEFEWKQITSKPVQITIQNSL